MAPTKKDFVDRLIALIKERPIIFDRNYRDFKNPEQHIVKRDKCYEEIAETMNVDVELIKTKWRNLRDSYSKFLKVQQPTTPRKIRERLKKYSTWPWAPQMSFMKAFLRLPSKRNRLQSPYRHEIEDDYEPHSVEIIELSPGIPESDSDSMDIETYNAELATSSPSPESQKTLSELYETMPYLQESPDRSVHLSNSKLDSSAADETPKRPTVIASGPKSKKFRAAPKPREITPPPEKSSAKLQAKSPAKSQGRALKSESPLSKTTAAVPELKKIPKFKDIMLSHESNPQPYQQNWSHLKHSNSQAQWKRQIQNAVPQSSKEKVLAAADLDDVDVLCLGYARAMKKLSRRRLITVNHQIWTYLMQQELEQYSEDNDTPMQLVEHYAENYTKLEPEIIIGQYDARHPE